MHCEKCGSKDQFMRRKGQNQVGLYCFDCGQWIKWVGKKDQQNLTRRGMKVHPESYSPPLTDVSSTPFEENTGSTPFDQDQDNNVSHTDFTHTDSFSNILYGSGDSTEGSSDTSTFSDDPCPTCISGVLDTLSKSDNIQMSIFDGTLIARSKDSSILYGTFKINHCPTCGRKLT